MREGLQLFLRSQELVSYLLPQQFVIFTAHFTCCCLIVGRATGRTALKELRLWMASDWVNCHSVHQGSTSSSGSPPSPEEEIMNGKSNNWQASTARSKFPSCPLLIVRKKDLSRPRMIPQELVVCQQSLSQWSFWAVMGLLHLGPMAIGGESSVACHNQSASYFAVKINCIHSDLDFGIGAQDQDVHGCLHGTLFKLYSPMRWAGLLAEWSLPRAYSTFALLEHQAVIGKLSQLCLNDSLREGRITIVLKEVVVNPSSKNNNWTRWSWATAGLYHQFWGKVLKCVVVEHF